MSVIVNTLCFTVCELGSMHTRKVESHCVVLRVVAELLGDDRIAKEEGEVREHVLTGGRDGAGGRELPGAVHVGSSHLSLSRRKAWRLGLCWQAWKPDSLVS